MLCSSYNTSSYLPITGNVRGSDEYIWGPDLQQLLSPSPTNDSFLNRNQTKKEFLAGHWPNGETSNTGGVFTRISESRSTVLPCKSLIKWSGHPTSLRLQGPELPTKETTPLSPKEAVTDLEAFCPRIDVVPDQEHQKCIIKILRQIFEDQELKLVTLSNQVQNLQEKVRSIGTRAG